MEKLSPLSLLFPSFLTDRAYGRYSDCIAGFAFRTDHLEKKATEPWKDRMLCCIHDNRCRVVALNSIGNQEQHEFALSLFNKWDVGKSEDDNGLLILLTLDIRDITFKTGYGLEGVLPDILCKRI